MLATNDIEQAQKKINELESLKQTALNRLIEIEDLKAENAKITELWKDCLLGIESLEKELRQANNRNVRLIKRGNDRISKIKSLEAERKSWLERY